MDLGKLTPGERIIGAGGTLLFLDSFFPWFRYCVNVVLFHRCVNHTGWSNILSTLAVLLAMAMVAQIAITRFTTSTVPTLGDVSWGQAHLFAGFAVLALVILQFLSGDSPLGRSVGLYIGLVLAAGIAYGGMIRSREPDITTQEGP
jgi:hypothetical protein